MPLVSGGIIWDYAARDNRLYPDRRLGQAALSTARQGVFPLGLRGAGIGATMGNGAPGAHGEAAGQGAVLMEAEGMKFFACTVLNARGAVHDRSGRVVRGGLIPEAGTRRSAAIALADGTEEEPETRGNTTLTVLVTICLLQGHDLEQVGRQAHSSMARAIQPFHTSFDGDLLWTVSTGEMTEPPWSTAQLGVALSEIAWDAVLAARPWDERPKTAQVA